MGARDQTQVFMLAWKVFYYIIIAALVSKCWSFCLRLPSTDIIGMHHHSQHRDSSLCVRERGEGEGEGRQTDIMYRCACASVHTNGDQRSMSGVSFNHSPHFFVCGIHT